MPQCQSADPARSPEVQRIILSHLIGRAAAIIAERLNLDPLQALEQFYESRTCAQLHDRATGLYLFSPAYIAECYMDETK